MFAKRKFNFFVEMSKNAPRGFQSPRLKAFMSKACVRNVLLLVVLSFASASLKAQDVLCFKNLQKEDVIVLSANSDEVSYRKYGDGSGDVHVAKASDLFYVQYQNGKTYRFIRTKTLPSPACLSQAQGNSHASLTFSFRTHGA